MVCKVEKWGITQEKANRVEIKPVDSSGNISEVPLEIETWVQTDGKCTDMPQTPRVMKS